MTDQPSFSFSLCFLYVRGNFKLLHQRGKTRLQKKENKKQKCAFCKGTFSAVFTTFFLTISLFSLSLSSVLFVEGGIKVKKRNAQHF